MESYREEQSCWLKLRAMEFLVTFLKNHNKSIDDSDVFSCIDENFSQAELLWEFRKHFPPKLRKVIWKNYKRDNHETFNLKTSPQNFLSAFWNKSIFHQRITEVLESLVRKEIDGYSEDEKNPEPKWVELVNMIQLDSFEEDILVITRCLSKNLLTVISERGRSNADDVIDFIAKCLNAPKQKVAEAVADTSKLRRFDCIDSDIDFRYSLEDFFSGIVTDPLSSRYYRKMQEETLPWDYFGELTETHGFLLKKLLTAGKPANILFYGAPGTGKSSFARTLAKEFGLTCYNVAIDAAAGGHLNRSDSSTDFRFAALQICDNSVVSSKSLLIVDEADEMLRGSTFSGFNSDPHNEKSRLNVVLDKLKTPVIWITNCPAYALDESSRRRFDYSIRFEPLNSRQRLTIWKNSVEQMKLESYFSEELLSRLSAEYPVSAGGIAQSLKNLANIAPQKDEVESLLGKLLSIHCELMDIDCRTDDKLMPALDYSLEGLNIKGDIKLDMIVGAVRKFLSEPAGSSPDRPRMNLLLAGPPGTGKTEFVKYLAQQLDKKIHVCMGSDLLNMYVGGTEQNIKKAFAQAEAAKAILFLDEIDGMVQSRERARNSWEVTQVNELLHQMENFNGVMIGATNFFKNLDPAVMRRFTFKLDFNYLDNEGKKLFFERMFKCVLTPGEIRRLNAIPNLAPGDFRTVRQALYYLDNDSNDLRLEALAKESSAKPDTVPGNTSSRFGF